MYSPLPPISKLLELDHSIIKSHYNMEVLFGLLERSEEN